MNVSRVFRAASRLQSSFSSLRATFLGEQVQPCGSPTDFIQRGKHPESC
jgi:hypothetical protein